MPHNTAFLRLVEQAKAQIQEISPEQVKDWLSTKQSFCLVDVREQDEWARGHLPQAIYLGKGIIERDIESAIPDVNANIVLYCGGGFRSALAAKAIQAMGYQHVFSMQEGFKGWVGRGFPVETD